VVSPFERIELHVDQWPDARGSGSGRVPVERGGDRSDGSWQGSEGLAGFGLEGSEGLAGGCVIASLALPLDKMGREVELRHAVHVGPGRAHQTLAHKGPALPQCNIRDYHRLSFQDGVEIPDRCGCDLYMPPVWNVCVRVYDVHSEPKHDECFMCFPLHGGPNVHALVIEIGRRLFAPKS